MPRVYVDADLALGREIVLSSEAAHHVRDVLRLARGDDLFIFDGRGTEHEALLIEVARHAVRAVLGAAHERYTESPLKVTLVQSISRGERMDYTIQKAVELGVRRIVPVTSLRTVVRLDQAREEKRLAHWRGIARHAAEQSGRNCLTEVSAVSTLAEWLRSRDEAVAYFLQPHVTANLAREAMPGAKLTLIAGPEGGFDEREVSLLHDAGVRAIRLGPRILRTETAALVALSIMQAKWGDLA